MCTRAFPSLAVHCRCPRYQPTDLHSHSNAVEPSRLSLRHRFEVFRARRNRHRAARR